MSVYPPLMALRPRFKLRVPILLLVLLTASWALSLKTAPTALSASALTVTSTADSGAGSLRQALLDANANAGPDVINFNIGSGAQRITVTSLLPTITGVVTIDGTTQPGFAGAPLIELTPDPQLLGDGLVITGGSSVVRGLVINKFRGHALRLETAGGNTIQGNYIGTDATGAVAAANSLNGIVVNGSNGNLIGGTTAAARNVISGNFGSAVGISSSSANIVQGNYLGVDVTGAVGLPNNMGVAVGPNAINNSIGGNTASARNVISANRMYGINMESADGTIVQGNYIGTNAAGDAALNNVSNDIRISDCRNTQIGGVASSTGSAPGNVFLSLSIFGGTATTVQGNLIGTNASGTARLNNFGLGIMMWGDTVVGGSVPGSGNVISGFTSGNGDGIFIANSGGGSILGNYIGTDITGTKSIPNKIGIVSVTNIRDNKIGGASAGERNVISGNNSNGIQVQANNAIIKGNYIGTDFTGTQPLPNGSAGILLMSGAVDSLIGGTESGAGNVMAFNGGGAVAMFPASPSQTLRNRIRGNSIYANNSIGIDLGSDLVTLNDAGDVDAGPNNLQNFPVVTSVTTGASTTIQGTLNSTASSTFTIDFYSSGACDPSGHGEGQNYIGATTAATDTNGNASFIVNLPVTLSVGQVVTATATDSIGNTSEFSVCYEIGLPGTVQFTASTYNGAESTGSATVYITRTLGTAATASVDYSTSDGTAIAGSDYSARTGTLSFAAGETTKSVVVPIINDRLDEAPETINLTLSNPTGGIVLGTVKTAVLTIADDDPQPGISVGDAVGEEGDNGTSPVNFVLTLSTVSGQSLSVRFSTSSASAQGGVDYQSVNQTVTFSPGETTKTIPVQAIGDLLPEANEVFGVSLTNATNVTISRGAGSGTIIDDENLVLQTQSGNSRAIALDSVTFMRDPFPVTNPQNFSFDQQNRIMLFATGAKLMPGEDATSVTAQALDSQGTIYPLVVEFAGRVPSSDWLTEVVVKLSDNLRNVGDLQVSITIHGTTSNKVIVSIRP